MQTLGYQFETLSVEGVNQYIQDAMPGLVAKKETVVVTGFF
jgi:hypothetical protein